MRGPFFVVIVFSILFITSYVFWMNCYIFLFKNFKTGYLYYKEEKGYFLPDFSKKCLHKTHRKECFKINKNNF